MLPLQLRQLYGYWRLPHPYLLSFITVTNTLHSLFITITIHIMIMKTIILNIVCAICIVTSATTTIVSCYNIKHTHTKKYTGININMNINIISCSYSRKTYITISMSLYCTLVYIHTFNALYYVKQLYLCTIYVGVSVCVCCVIPVCTHMVICSAFPVPPYPTGVTAHVTGGKHTTSGVPTQVEWSTAETYADTQR